jgi:hypothetical protein
LSEEILNYSSCIANLPPDIDVTLMDGGAIILSERWID